MEIRELAERILHSPELEEKLRPFELDLTDLRPGPAERLVEPARADHLRFAPKRQGAKMPKGAHFADPRNRAVAHHIMANHELQALEIMAWTLLAFPDAPPTFRSGMLAIMRDEQRHTRMHVRRLHELGIDFGDLPLNGHVWIRCRGAESLLDYLAALPLTFEGGNLDHSLEFASYFDDAGDRKSREVMKAIHVDEIDHVAFGVEWLRSLKPDQMSEWETYVAHLRWPLAPFRGKGHSFQREARLRAGMSEEFIAQVEAAERLPAR